VAGVRSTRDNALALADRSAIVGLTMHGVVDRRESVEELNAIAD
jgi:hypothetical protein